MYLCIVCSILLNPKSYYILDPSLRRSIVKILILCPRGNLERIRYNATFYMGVLLFGDLQRSIKSLPSMLPNEVSFHMRSGP